MGDVSRGVLSRNGNFIGDNGHFISFMNMFNSRGNIPTKYGFYDIYSNDFRGQYPTYLPFVDIYISP